MLTELAAEAPAFTWPAETWDYLRAALCIAVFTCGTLIGVNT